MLSRRIAVLGTALSLGLAGAVYAADHGMSKDEYKAEKDRISKEAKANKDKCKGMSGNAKDICMAEAKGQEKVAKAELDARYKNTAKAQEKVQEAKPDPSNGAAPAACPLPSRRRHRPPHRLSSRARCRRPERGRPGRRPPRLSQPLASASSRVSSHMPTERARWRRLPNQSTVSSCPSP